MKSTKHLKFLEELRSRLKPDETVAKTDKIPNADSSDCDEYDEELLAALERKFDELFGPIDADDG